MKTMVILFVLALAACAKESDPDREIVASTGASTPAPGSTGSGPGSSPASTGSNPAASPSPSPDAPGAEPTPTHTLPPQNCDDSVVVAYDCWTDKFPRELSGKSDVECRYTVTCCGSVVSDWRRKYPQSAGPSGVVAHKSEKLTAKCRTDLPRLGDLDEDGVPNTSDDHPFAAGTARPF